MVDYYAYIDSDAWREKRILKMRSVLNWRGHLLCGHCRHLVWQGAIQVHHKTYDRLGDERLSDLEVLCDGCHALEHGKSPPLWYEHERSKWKKKDLLDATMHLVQFGEAMDEAIEHAIPIVIPVVSRPRVFSRRPWRGGNGYGGLNRMSLAISAAAVI